MAEYLISLQERIKEVETGRRDTIEGMVFLGSVGGDRIAILEWNRQSNLFKYRRTFPRSGDVRVSSDVSVLGDLDRYFDVETVKGKDLTSGNVYPVSGRSSACVDIGD